MRKSPLALLLSLICLISSHNEIQAQGHPPTDSLRQRAAASVGKEKHDLLMRIAMSTNDIADWDATLNDAIDRYDTPAICQSRLNRIQCLFNFYSGFGYHRGAGKPSFYIGCQAIQLLLLHL